MVLPLSPKRIELGSCACAHIEAREEGNGWFYPDNAGNLSEIGRNEANLISESCSLFCPFSSNWCRDSANISGVKAH